MIKVRLYFTEIWARQCFVRNIFRAFENGQDLTGKEKKLYFIGFRNFLEKGKMSFIDGVLHERIYGIEDFGGRVGRLEDDLFFEKADEINYNAVSADTIVELITRSIALLRESKVEPTIIILEPTYAYKNDELVEHPRYSRTSFPLFDIGTSGLIGYFDGIPMFSSHSNLLKGRVLVADFTGSFDMEYKTNDNWYKSLLEVSVEEISEGMAIEKLESEPDKWRPIVDDAQLSEADALTLIRTSVIIQIGSIANFVVKDARRYCFGYVLRPIQD